MPMGFTNAFATLIQMMNNLFSDMLDSGIVVFLDDILAYSCTMKEHFTLLEKLLVCLHQYIFYRKLKKCSFFFYNSATFRSFDITPKGMYISDSKLWSLNEWPVPTVVE